MQSWEKVQIELFEKNEKYNKKNGHAMKRVPFN